MKRPRVDKTAKDTLGVESKHAAGVAQRKDIAQGKLATGVVPCSDSAPLLSESIPSFMDDMPGTGRFVNASIRQVLKYVFLLTLIVLVISVSPPSSPTLRTIPLSPAQDSDVQESTAQEPDTESRHESSNDDPPSRETDTTPQRDTTTPTNVTPQRPGNKSSPFRTPTEKSRHTLSNTESLDLSPQDSVFWARTPPSEALRKLRRLSNGRSHDEGTCSSLVQCFIFMISSPMHRF